MSASDADRTCEYGDADQCPNERNPIFFTREVYGAWGRSQTGGPSRVRFATTSRRATISTTTPTRYRTA